MMCERPFVKSIPGKHWDLERATQIPLPCGRCLHCRINRSRMWQTRIMFEQFAHKKSCFVTLTYNNDSLPFDCENLTNPLVKKDLQNFFKKLRRISGRKFRYYAVGEYGREIDKIYKTAKWRPHYHVILFGFGSGDKNLIEGAWNTKYNRKNKRFDRDDKGFVYIGTVTRASARYVTKYVTETMNIYDDWYYKLVPDEFATMSKMDGGLGIKVVEEAAKKMESENIGVIETFNIKGKEVNIGRYLKRKLHEKRGLSEEDFDGLFYLYQKELYEKHNSGDGVWFENFMEEDRVKRLKKAHNIKTFRKKSGKL